MVSNTNLIYPLSALTLGVCYTLLEPSTQLGIISGVSILGITRSIQTSSPVLRASSLALSLATMYRTYTIDFFSDTSEKVCSFIEGLTFSQLATLSCVVVETLRTAQNPSTTMIGYSSDLRLIKNF